MAAFLFHLGNHSEFGRKTLEDPRDIIAHQLASLGHRIGRSDEHVFASPTLDGEPAINVLFEGWNDLAAVDDIRAARRSGARFLVIATEEPTDEGFNHGVNPEMIRRQEVFGAVAEHVDAVWCLVPGAARWFSRFASACDVELGYAPSLVRRARVNVDHEFAFFGNPTPRRQRILQRLADKVQKDQVVRLRRPPVNAVLVNVFTTQAHRDNAMSRARVIVQLRAVEQMGLVSSSRCNTALHLGRPVVAEPHELDHVWKDIVHFSRTIDGFYRDAIEMRHVWHEAHRMQFKAFQEALSPEQTVGRALRDTGLLVQARRAA